MTFRIEFPWTRQQDNYTARFRQHYPLRFLADHLANIGVEPVVLNDGEPHPPADSIDAVFFYGFTRPETINGAVQLRSKGLTCGWFLDDNLWELPDYIANRSQFPHADNLDIMLGLVDFVWCSTDALCQYVAGRSRRHRVGETVFHCPDLHDAAEWGEAHCDFQPSHPKEGQFRVLWQGSSSHDADIAFLGELATLLPNDVQLVVMGGGDRLTLRDTDLTLPWVEAKDFAQTLVNLDADLLLAPLADNEFNRYKSPLKLIEARLLNVSVVASHVGPYRLHGTAMTGMAPAAWCDQIMRLRGRRNGLGPTWGCWQDDAEVWKWKIAFNELVGGGE